MDSLQFLQVIYVLIFAWFVQKRGKIRKDSNDFEIQVAKEYTMQLHIHWLEQRIRIWDKQLCK